MKKKITVKLEIKFKTRAHRVLFDNTLPFQPKVVENKKSFKRHKKHKGKDHGNCD